MEISFQVPLAVASSQGQHKTKISQEFHQAERSGREFQANGITCPKAYWWESSRIIKEKANIPMGFETPKSCGIKEKLLTMELHKRDYSGILQNCVEKEVEEQVQSQQELLEDLRPGDRWGPGLGQCL